MRPDDDAGAARLEEPRRQLPSSSTTRDGRAYTPGYRVKVKLPWLNDQGDTSGRGFAVPMSGNDRGTYVLPEIDDRCSWCSSPATSIGRS